ncbi:unnamed protein product [Agarophyton chilense]|eukprot:gb/GEZJ01004313.1/.p1 GENE.gb/GEZJ01004313.1/~~gb/GEZJ01004313.1/.p1  ORF type:complete len:281 (-),score=28.01 gb/GEZJ01004313.1/:1773-2615(-)
MIAFAPSTALTSARVATSGSSFTTNVPCVSPSRRPHNAPTMALRRSLVKPTGTTGTSYGGAATILNMADGYMAKSVLNQYLNISQPTGVYGVQCAEGSVQGAADATRVRALSNRFRAKQASPAKKYGDLYENRKNAVLADHICQYEESLFTKYPKLSSTYNLARSEAYGTCIRYATPESVQEAAMMRYMDIQQNIAANPTGVYNSSCNEGTVRGQAEQLRVAALNVAYRNAQKPIGQIMNERYQQKKYGYNMCHGCTYEESLVSKYPAIGAAFRQKSYGY